MNKTKRRGLTLIICEISTFETGGVIKSVNTATGVVD